MIVGLFFLNSLKAQSYEDLRNKWLYAKSDTARVNAGLKLDNYYYFSSTDSTKAGTILMTSIYRFSKKTNYSYGLIESSFRLGGLYNTLFDNYKAIEYYYLSLKHSENYKDNNGIARAQMGIGLVHYGQNNWIKAIEYFKKSLSLSKLNNNVLRASTQYYLIGLSQCALKNYKNSKLFLDSALTLKKKLNDSLGIYETFLGLASVYKGLLQYDSAEFYYNKTLPRMLASKENHPLSIIYTAFAEIDLAKNNIENALHNGLEGYKYANSFINPIPKLDATYILFKIYYRMGDYKNAIKYNILHHILKDSIENRDYSSQLEVAQASHDFEKKQTNLKAEQDKKELEYFLNLRNVNRKRYIWFGLTLLSFLLIIIVLIAYRYVTKQKRISENLLLNILPKQTTVELKKFGKAISKNHEEVSIMFCDVKNFTQIAETLNPGQVVEMLDRYFQQFDLVAESYGIEKIKTIGDSYMCANGLENLNENNALKMVNAAIEFLQWSELIKPEIEKEYNQSFSFRVGIHTGNVVSGVVGKNKYAYDIWGDAVNVAARLEQNSLPGMINISGSTYHFVKNSFNCTYRGKIPAKNKGEIDMYFVEKFNQ